MPLSLRSKGEIKHVNMSPTDRIRPGYDISNLQINLGVFRAVNNRGFLKLDPLSSSNKEVICILKY